VEKQRTIKDEITTTGVGLHNGKVTRITLKPALPNTGITFVRADIYEKPLINVETCKIIDLHEKPRRTSIGNGEIEVQTVEHMMAALYGCAIDNIVIEVEGDEMPGMDGSALPFLELIKKAEIIEQDAPRKFYQVREPLWVEEGNSFAIVLPHQNFQVSYTLSYDHEFLTDEYLDIVMTPEACEREIVGARTFCLQEEVEPLRRMGLGKGADYDNTVVVAKKKIVRNILRFSDEFVRHKVLDLTGDLYLLGCPLKGRVIAIKSGHSINVKLLQKIRQQKERFLQSGIKAPDVQLGLGELDINMIQKILPHRHPFLLVDRIISLEKDKRAVGIKNVTINDNFFVGHFPTRPIMPGVLILEALAQTAGVLLLSKEENMGRFAYFLGIDNAKFRQAVVPGDQLVLEIEITKLKSKVGQAHGEAKINGKVACEADLKFTLVD